MSASDQSKKSRATQQVTSARAALPGILLGMAFFVMGLCFLLSVTAPGSSVILGVFSRFVSGIGGWLCYVLPVLMIIGGLKLMVSARHKVSVRAFFIFCGLYWLLLCLLSLITRVPDNDQTYTFMEYVGKRNFQRSVLNADSLSAYLTCAFNRRGEGGWLGMLLAYPLWKSLGGLLGAVVTVLLMLLLICLLLRFNPLLLLRTDPEKEAAKAARRAEKARLRMEAEAQQAAAPMPEPPIPDTASPVTAPEYPPEAEIPDAAYRRPDKNGFVASVPGKFNATLPLYDAETRPEIPEAEAGWSRTVPDEAGSYAATVNPPAAEDMPQDEPAPAPKPASPWKRPVSPVHAGAEPVSKPVPTPSITEEESREKAPASMNQDTPDTADNALPHQETHFAQPEPKSEPQTETPAIPVQPTAVSRQNASVPVPSTPAATASVPHHAPAVPFNKPPQADEDADDDLPPWDEPVKPVSHVANVPVKKPETPAQPRPATSDWLNQTRTREAELKMPEHTGQRGEPKPVYTDPVMPLTGERIAIHPVSDPLPGSNLDGTLTPVEEQKVDKAALPYQPYPIRLLKESKVVSKEDAAQEDEHRAQIIEETLRSFQVESEVKQIMHGPAITRFAIQIAPGVKVNRVTGTADNLALELKSKHVRVEAPIQGTNYIGIEVPNKLVSTVSLREVLDSEEMRASMSPTVVALGMDIAGAPILCDLSKMPHLLIAGATGSGKSVCINSIVCSILYRTPPSKVRLIMIDPKQVELSVYNNIPHLLIPVISDPRKAAGALAWVVQEMLDRYGRFSREGVRNLAGYNKMYNGTEKELPNIVVIIDEMADLMETCRKDVEESIRRLAALARAAGIYMVLATQRPSVDVITGVIKNNIPSRIAFAVSSGTDSRTILDIYGAEKLMGKGDMLYKPAGASPMRVQGCFVSDDEVMAITQFISERYETDYDPNIIEHLENEGNKERQLAADETTGEPVDTENMNMDQLLQEAIEMAIEDGQTSTSMLQRRLRIGYARAGRLVDEMEKRGIVSASEGSKPRKTLMTREQYFDLAADLQQNKDN